MFYLSDFPPDNPSGILAALPFDTLSGMAFGSDWAQTVHELAIRCFGPAPMKKQADQEEEEEQRTEGGSWGDGGGEG